MKTRIFKDNESTARAFADFLVEKSAQNDSLTIALSGGSTPKVLFKILSSEYRESVDWSKVSFFWGDDRMVPPTHEDSNFKWANELLFKPLGISESQIFRILGENEPEAEAINYSKVIEQNVSHENGLPSFDIVWLGLGTDGHTASIFPNEIDLIEEERTCAIGTNPEIGQKRVTLTGPVINNAKHICFLVTGASKAEKINEILNKTENHKSYPAAHIQAKNGELTWFIDEAAAAKLG